MISRNRVEGLCEDFEFSEDEVIPGQVICRDDGYLKYVVALVFHHLLSTAPLNYSAFYLILFYCFFA